MGIADPEFGHDVGFFVFDLPFYRSVLNWSFVALVLAFVANLGTQYLFGGLRVTTGKAMLTNRARVQLSVLAGTFILLKAVAYWFDRYDLLSGGRKEPTFTGAGYTDIHAELPAKFVMLAIAVLCAVAFFAAIFLHDMRIPAMATALLVLSSIVVSGAWPLMMEQFSVRPNAADVERQYIERNIEATRQAYRIGDDWVEYRDYPGVGTKAPRDVSADMTTIANVRLLDPNVLSRTFTQQQQLKNFYGFPENLDIDRYRIDGELRDYVVAARELSPNSLTGNQTDWINRHTVYTHGDGFVAAPANRVNAAVRDAANTSDSNSGYPIYAVSDIASQESGRTDHRGRSTPRLLRGGDRAVQSRLRHSRRATGLRVARIRHRHLQVHLHRRWRRAHRKLAQPCVVRHQIRRTQPAVLAGDRLRVESDLPPRPEEPRATSCPVADHRLQRISGSGARTHPLDRRRVHNPGRLPVCATQLTRSAAAHCHPRHRDPARRCRTCAIPSKPRWTHTTAR